VNSTNKRPLSTTDQGHSQFPVQFTICRHESDAPLIKASSAESMKGVGKRQP
jgi:hypothetical protein